ncbi:MAG: NADP-dependent oxidoreductase [Acidimicrobiales bacterium]|nr:NADP-dependent oxidoreductase [Acidimicrobiales bacterium]
MTAIVTNPDRSLSPVQVERPTPGPTEVLIKNAAAGINPVDWKIRANGDIFRMFDPNAPMILGWDVAGEIVEAGAGVTRFAAGDRVFGMPRFPRPAGGYAEYVVAGSREVARIPDNVADIEAGALPLAVLTAWQSIVDTLKVCAGDRVLIHAASGGVGHLAVQIAKARGAEVWGTASAENHAALRDLGLDHPIDYKTERFEDIATDMDAVLDLVGTSDYPTRSVQSLKPGGKLVVVPSPEEMPPQEALDKADVTATWILVEPDYAALECIARMLQDGTLRVAIADTRPLSQIGELHAIGETGGPMGKLVATIN